MRLKASWPLDALGIHHGFPTRTESLSIKIIYIYLIYHHHNWYIKQNQLNNQPESGKCTIVWYFSSWTAGSLHYLVSVSLCMSWYRMSKRDGQDRTRFKPRSLAISLISSPIPRSLPRDGIESCLTWHVTFCFWAWHTYDTHTHIYI
jgi:hypothetical protein